MKNKNIKLFILFLLINVIFIDIVGAETYNNYSSSVTSCGNNLLSKIPTLIPSVVSVIYTIIQIAIPILLVIFGMLDLMKGIASQKEDEIKKGQAMFIKRLIAGVLVFFIFVIVKVVISISADNSGSRIIECAECFIKNECD